MKVNISVVGRFHGFDLAKQLQDKGMLNLLNTTYPKFITKRWGIEKSKIRSNYFLEFLNRYVSKYATNFLKSKINIYVKTKQAKSNIKYLKNTDVLIGWSGSSLEAFAEVKKNKKTITILERGSSHYSYQMNILEEEFSKFGKSFNPDYKTWQRELLEYELADYVSIPSNFVKKSFEEYGIPSSKLLLNPYGVDLSAFKQIKKQDDVFRVVFVGGFNIRKGGAYLLQAFSELNLPNSELIHLGSINEEMSEVIKKYEASNIKYLGSKPQNELYKYYSQGSVFVMMSIEEGLSMVQLQAMACGLPLICTSNTGGEDLITENGKEGYVIPIRGVEVLKEKLLFLYENPEKTKKMGEAAKNRVAKGFSWDDYGDRYVNNLNKIQRIDEN
jgi:glycosyltransferase involved in cell wall biosynthesis